MTNTGRISTGKPGRSVSDYLLDLVFGEPLPQPEVVEHDGEQAWQEWLDAKARQDGSDGFEDTRPMAVGRPRDASAA